MQATEPKPRSPEFWSHDLDYLLNVSPAALGLRGTSSAVIAAIERGGPSTSSDHEWVLDEQIGWGRKGVNAVDRTRRLERLWRQLPSSTRGIHTVHYTPRQLPPGVRSYMLAADRRTCLAGVTLWLCSRDERARLADAALQLDQKPQSWGASPKGKACVIVIRELVKRAVEPVRAAHEEWYALLRGQAKAWVA